MHRQGSKKQTQKYHDRSLEDFMKHLKKYNLKSERQDRMQSPDPLAPYRNHTLERSRTLSGNKSRKTNRTTRQKIQRLLSRSKSRDLRPSPSRPITHSHSAVSLPNPADLIAQFSKRIRQAQQVLQGKSKMGMLLCKKFLEMLNEIVENMVLNLQHNLQQLEKSIYERLERQIGEQAEKKIASIQRKMAKLERQTFKLLEKQNYNNNLVYHLRLQNIDIDKAFGQCVFGSDKFGGLGYSHSEKENHSDPQSLNPISSSELIFVKRRDEVQEREGNGEGWEWQPNIGRGHEG